MSKDKESLLNEANLLSLRINEIYTASFEIHKNLLKDGYYDASLESIFNRADGFKIQLEKITEKLKSFNENQNDSVNNDSENISISIEDINQIAESLGAEINDVVFYPAKLAKYAPIPANLHPNIKQRIEAAYP